MNTPIYEIYRLSKKWQLDSENYPTCGSMQRLGFYYTQQEAINAIEQNLNNLQGGYAKAAQIRAILPGLEENIVAGECLYYVWNEQNQQFELNNWPNIGESK